MALSREAIVRGLVAQGVPRAVAEATAERESASAGRRTMPAPEVSSRSALALPVRLVIPWSLLVSDNEKYGAMEGRLILTPRYRQAKAAIANRAREQLGDVEPAAFPLELTAAVWVPDRRPHDVANFGKCVHDALERVVYVRDRWLKRVLWYEAGVDVDAPRTEITIVQVLAG